MHAVVPSCWCLRVHTVRAKASSAISVLVSQTVQCLNALQNADVLLVQQCWSTIEEASLLEIDVFSLDCALNG